MDCSGSIADRTGLEPATSAVTGRHSNQLNYRSGYAPSDRSGCKCTVVERSCKAWCEISIEATGGEEGSMARTVSCVSDSSGKPASDRRECGLGADSATP